MFEDPSLAGAEVVAIFWPLPVGKDHSMIPRVQPVRCGLAAILVREPAYHRLDLKGREEIERRIGKSRKIFVGEVGIDHGTFLAGDRVENGKLRGGRTNLVHEGKSH